MRTTIMLLISLLLLALATIFSCEPGVNDHANNGLPEFSWDHVSLYAHIGIGDGLKPEQYKFLAKNFDLICLSGGILSANNPSSIETNIRAGALTIKKYNPKAKVLMYWASDLPKHQWKISNATFPEGGYLSSPDGSYRCFDVSNQYVRDWWSDVASKAVHDYSCDGIFVDGATAARPGGPWSQRFGKKRAVILEEGMFAMLRQARTKMGSDKLIIFNPLHGYHENEEPLGWRYLPVADGAMIDDFDRAANIRQQSKEYMANTIEVMSKAAKDGKIIVFKAWPGFTWWSNKEILNKPHEEIHRLAKERITFPLACFLIGVEPHCYFCYTWGWLPEYGSFDWYPEFDKPLGPPKGDAIRKGWTYRREFEHASVFVDLENKSARIDWR